MMIKKERFAATILIVLGTFGLAFGDDSNLRMDDGFTFFEAEPAKEYSAAAKGNVDIGWTLKYYLRVMGTLPDRSAFRVNVLKAGKKVASVRCSGYVRRKKSNREAGDDFMWANLGCLRKNQVIKSTGNFDIQVNVVNGDTDEETLVRSYKVKVRKASRVRGQPSKTAKRCRALLHRSARRDSGRSPVAKAGRLGQLFRPC